MANATADPVTSAIERAVAIANTFRASMGEPSIEDLLPGVSGNSLNCTLARTFNYGCDVDYSLTYDEETGASLGAQHGSVSFYGDTTAARLFWSACRFHGEEASLLADASGDLTVVRIPGRSRKSRWTSTTRHSTRISTPPRRSLARS